MHERNVRAQNENTFFVKDLSRAINWGKLSGEQLLGG